MVNASGIEVGLVGRYERTVQESDTADAQGNRGVRVLSTPTLILWLECAANVATEGRLPAGYGEVGVRIDVRHLGAATVGTRVRCEARLVGAIDGRKLTYLVKAEDGDGRALMEGTLERRVVDLARFHERSRHLAARIAK
ncbi:MAG TPA: thioesterase [Thermodesulfobacteriota bacterium]